MQIPKQYRGNIARRDDLVIKKAELEAMIFNCKDINAVSKLRADYRRVTEELELYYDDELEGLSDD